MSVPFIEVLDNKDLVLFAKERWCVQNNIDPSYVVDITDFSKEVVKLFLEDRIPNMALLNLVKFVEYYKANGMTRDKAIQDIRKYTNGYSQDDIVLTLWDNPSNLRTDQLEIVRKFVEGLNASDYFEKIYNNIQSAFSLRDYVLYGINQTTLPVIDIYNRLIPTNSIPVLYYRDQTGNISSKTNVRYNLRNDFSVDAHFTDIAKTGTNTILGIMDVSGRYVSFHIYQYDRNLTVETEMLVGNEGYYCLSELQKLVEAISSSFIDKFRWNIKDIRYKLANFGSDSIPAIPTKGTKAEKDNITKERKRVIRETTSMLYGSLLSICSKDPMRFILRPETTTTVGSMKFRVVNYLPLEQEQYKGEAVLNSNPEDDEYEGGRTSFKVPRVGNVAISSVDASKATGVDIRIDIETTLQDLINTLSIIWFAILSTSANRNKHLYLRNDKVDISNPVVDIASRKDVYVLLKNTASGMIHRAAPFISLWKNKICNQDVMPYFYNGELTEDKKKEIAALEAKYKEYKFDQQNIYYYPDADMVARLSLEKGYTLYSEPIRVLLPKSTKENGGMFLRIRDAPRRLRDSFAGLNNNYAHLFDRTLCIAKQEKDSDDKPTSSDYVLDSIKDEIPLGKFATIDSEFFPSIENKFRTSVPESGYSSFLATALMVLTKEGVLPTISAIYTELKKFVKDIRESPRTKYFLPMWKFFPGAGFTEFQERIMESYFLDMENIVIENNKVIDKSTLFMDSKIFSRAYSIYFGKNIIIYEYVEKNNDMYEPLDLDRLCFAYPEILDHIAEDGLATEIFNYINPNVPSYVVLRRRYTNINSQYDAFFAKSAGKYNAEIPTDIFTQEIRKQLFEMNFISTNGDTLVENSERGRMTFDNIVGQFLDNTGRQTGVKVRVGKYELAMMWCRTQPISSVAKILPLTEANNPYNVKKLLRIFQEIYPGFNVSHYSTIPLVVNKNWQKLVCGFYLRSKNDEIFVPCSLYEGIPSNFANLTEKPSIYPYHMTGISQESGIISKLNNRQISDAMVAMLLSAIRTMMIKKLISGEWNKSTLLSTVIASILDKEGEPEVIPVSENINPETQYQSLLNGLRKAHRLPADGDNVFQAMYNKKEEEYSLLFSKEGKIYVKSLSSSNRNALNNVEDSYSRLVDQIRLFWKYIPELMEGLNVIKMKEAISRYGENHPIYRIHLLEDDFYYAYRYEGCLFLSGEEMIRNYYLIGRKQHRIHHRLWTNLNTDSGPEFFAEKGLGVHRIYRMGVVDANVAVNQLSENDFPTRIDKSICQTKEETFFELVPI